jgi:hypothetical protein
MEDQTPQKRPTIVVCIPGREFSIHFMRSWSEMLYELVQLGFNIRLSTAYNSMVHFARSACLMGSSLGGEKQPVLKGADYDYIMWIDSDMVFRTQDLLTLLDSPHDVTCGLYKMQGGVQYAAVKDWDEDYFRQHGTFQFLTDESLNELRSKGRYADVAYAGLGWMLIRKGVMERMSYPWFTSRELHIDKMVELCSEDVTFCRRLIHEAGVRVFIDTTVVVGHVKEVVL